MPYAMVARRPGGIGELHKTDIEPPEPGPGEVALRHTAIGVNFIDVYFRTGLYPWPVDRGLILGCEAAGVVKATGEGVHEFKPGDRVAYTLRNGAYATHRIIAARHLVAIPPSISDKIAAGCMLKGLTAHYLLHRSFKVLPRQTVLFHAAAGGVGLIAGQWLAAKGVNAIGTAGGPDKCALARENGYSHVIDYKSSDFVGEVMEITNGEGVHAVYDSIGKDTYPGSLQCLRTFGTLVCFGQSSGPALDFKLSDLAAGSYTVTRPSLFHFADDRQWLTKAAEELFAMIDDGHVRIPINQVLPLEDVGHAHELLESRQTTGCTILIP